MPILFTLSDSYIQSSQSFLEYVNSNTGDNESLVLKDCKNPQSTGQHMFCEAAAKVDMAELSDKMYNDSISSTLFLITIYGGTAFSHGIFENV
jgi:hypothetical protein